MFLSNFILCATFVCGNVWRAKNEESGKPGDFKPTSVCLAWDLFFPSQTPQPGQDLGGNT